MTRKEKRLIVIKDVLSRLRYRKVDINYYIKDIPIKELKSNNLNRDLQQDINKIEKCQACALGNVLISHIRVFDKLTYEDIGFYTQYSSSNYESYCINGYTLKNDVVNVLLKYFSQLQLDMIEAAFEQTDLYVKDFVKKRNRTKILNSIKFGKKYKDPKTRLRAILNNILDNDGLFRP